MNINITSLVTHDNFDPYMLSNSRANLGDDAGAITWRNCVALSDQLTATPPDLLPTPEHEQEFRDFVKGSGGWSKDEIAAWDHAELHALLVQWIAGDLRNGFGDDLPDDPSEWDWIDYEERCEAGITSSSISRGDDGRVYFYIGC